MILLYIVLLAILLSLLYLVIKDFSQGFQLRVHAEMDSGDMLIDISFCEPVLKIQVNIHDYVPFIKVVLFGLKIINARIYRRKKTGGRNMLRLVRSASINNVDISALYGFSDPYMTGIIYAAALVVAKNLRLESMSIAPDYISGKDYLRIDARAQVKLGQSILNYVSS